MTDIHLYFPPPELLTGSQDAVNTLVGSLLDNTVVDVDANVTVGGLGGLGGIGGGSSPISLAPLESLVSGLSGSGLVRLLFRPHLPLFRPI